MSTKKNSGKTLNIGCGSDIWGDIRIDINPSAPGANIISDAHHLPLKDRSIKQIKCQEVLEHVESPIRVLREMKRVLADDGYIELSIPNLYEWRRILWNIRHPTKIRDVHKTIDHKQGWDGIEFQTLCNQVGLKVKDVQYLSLGNRRTRKLWFLDCLLKLILPPLLFHTHVKYTLVKDEKT
ncbi:MAG: methyltransferase domain-containing protein [Candidatus Methanomethylicaceae archaeon]